MTIEERNRINATHSTGPRTPEGKAVSSQNARKHGLSITTHHLLANEDPEVYAAFETDILDIYDPQSKREHLAAVEIAKARWALRRFDEAEMTLLNTCLCSDGQTPGEALAYCCIAGSEKSELPSMERLMRYRRPWDRKHQEAIKEFDRARLDRHREERLTLAKEKHAKQQSKEPKETRAERDAREMRHMEILFGGSRDIHHVSGFLCQASLSPNGISSRAVPQES